MSERPEWMPGVMVILEIQDGEYIDGEVDDAFRKTGLRAQLAALEELNENSLTLEELIAGIVNKIIALRKELEG